MLFFRQVLPKVLPVVHIFSFIITTYSKKKKKKKKKSPLELNPSVKRLSSRIISLNHTPCISHLTKNMSPSFILLVAPTMYGLPCPFSQPTIWEKPCRWGKNPVQQQKNAHFPHQKNPPHQYELQFIAVVIAAVLFFLTSSFMYRYIMLILISWGLLNLICSMTKALNDQNSFKQNFPVNGRFEETL